MSDTFLVGCAAGFSGDRTDVALPVVKTMAASGRPACLIFETLAERTLALAQLARRADPARGYEPLLDLMVTPILAPCLEHGIRIVSNFGAANPAGAAQRIREIARSHGLRAPRIAVVSGDDLSGPAHRELLRGELGSRLDRVDVVSANAYLGAEPIAAALRAGADIVVCGRVADPSLVVGPTMAHFDFDPFVDPEGKVFIQFSSARIETHVNAAALAKSIIDARLRAELRAEGRPKDVALRTQMRFGCARDCGISGR